MKNTIALTAFMVFVTISLFAQKNTWTIGLYSGIQGQFNTSIKPSLCLTSTIHRISPVPPAELIVQYKITDYFSLASGIGYTQHTTQGKDEFYYTIGRDAMSCLAFMRWIRSPRLQVPFILQYDIPLKNTGFSFFAKFGLYFDFRCMADDRGNGALDSLYYDSYAEKTFRVEFTESSDFWINDVNFLIHTGIGFSYRFRSGWGISLSGTHNIGTLLTNSLNYNLKLKDLNSDILEHELVYNIYNRNQNWNVLLGVSYTFKQKKKA
jgi:hypothetical protein